MAQSRDAENERSHDRAQKITKYINEHPDCVLSGQTLKVTINNIQEKKPVYYIPHELLKLNPDNGRFRSKLLKISKQRQNEGKNSELNPDDDDDKKIIQELLNGTNPYDETKKQHYAELRKNFIDNGQNGDNGQENPGIISHDGIIINGNRRVTILHELFKTPSSEYDPLNFSKIKVIRLPNTISNSDVIAIEAKEQISPDSRERYDYTNASLQISLYMKNLMKNSHVSEDIALDEICKRIYGMSKKEINDHIEFIKTANKFLTIIGKPEQYDYIQNIPSGDGSKGIVQIIQELGKQEEKIIKIGNPHSITNQLLNALYKFAWYSKEQPKIINYQGKEEPLPFNHRSWSRFLKDALGNKAARNTLLEYDGLIEPNWDDPNAEANDFDVAIKRARVTTDIERDKLEPIIYLEESSLKIKKVLKGMNNSTNLDMIEKVKKSGLEYILSIKSDITEIHNKINKLG